MLNSVRLAKDRLRVELTHSGHSHQLYTYNPDYHTLTFEPVDVESEQKKSK